MNLYAACDQIDPMQELYLDVLKDDKSWRYAANNGQGGQLKESRAEVQERRAAKGKELMDSGSVR
jgi:hypothetical protein